MLVKYLDGTRLDFLTNGLFRITQPSKLNDPKGEGQFAPFYNKFSKADLNAAYKKYLKSSLYNPAEQIQTEDLINWFLKPTGKRYTLEEFPGLAYLTEFKTTDEMDRDAAEKFINYMNEAIIKTLDNSLGIFSLSNSLTNNNMWIKYGNHGKGIALEFDIEHPFFKFHQVRQVNYSNEDRASITYYEGSIFINGVKIKSHFSSMNETIKYLFEELDLNDLEQRLFFTKNERWKDEYEKRIIFSLADYDELKSNNVYLKKFPFQSFKTLTFGWDYSSNEIQGIKDIVKMNHELNHLKLQKVRYGKLEKYDDLEVFEL